MTVCNRAEQRLGTNTSPRELDFLRHHDDYVLCYKYTVRDAWRIVR